MSSEGRQLEIGAPTVWPQGLIGGARHAAQLLFGAGRRLELAWGFLLLLIVGVASVLLVIGNREYNQLVAHTLDVRSRAYQLLTLVQDVEVGQRSYMLTNNPSYLDRYRKGVESPMPVLGELQNLTADNPHHQNGVVVLKPPTEARLEVAAQTATRHQ